MVEFERGHNYTLSAEPEWFLHRGFKAIEGIVSSLAERFWRASVSSSGSFIGSDDPVSMDGPNGQDIGFKSAEVVMFPVSRHFLVYGTNCRVKATNTTRKRIAAHNTFTMLTADKQVYSHVPGNCSRKRNSCRAPLPRPKNPDPEDKVYGPNQASKNR